MDINNIKITKEDALNMELLTNEQLDKLSFHELCLYLETLNIAEKIIEGDEG